MKNYKNFKEFYAQCLVILKIDNPSVKKALKRLYSNACKRYFDVVIEGNTIVISRTKNNKKLFNKYHIPELKKGYDNDMSNYSRTINSSKNIFDKVRLSNGNILKDDINIRFIIDTEDNNHYVNYNKVSEILNFTKSIKKHYSSYQIYLKELWEETKTEDVYHYGYKKICIEDNLPFKKGMLFDKYASNFPIKWSPDQHLKEYEQNQDSYNVWKKYKGFIGDLNLKLTERNSQLVSKCIKVPTYFSCPRGCLQNCRKNEFKSVENDSVYKKYLELKKLKETYIYE
jgi:hypothetical protein